MNKLGLTLLFLLCFCMTFAQNPFEDYGYEPQIGTLSKGKYIEHFDNDSLVKIGTVIFNTYTNTITKFVIEETTFTEAGAEPTIMSRWMNPDPLSDEFPEWSPYNFVENNPIRYTDPTGLAPEDIVINTLDPTTNEYTETVRIKSDKIDQTINLDVPTPLAVNPVTNSGNMQPIVINGLDGFLEKLDTTVGKVDAFMVSLGAGFAGIGGVGGSLDIIGLLSGEDAGGVFLYGNSDPAVNVGLGVNIGLEVGAIFDHTGGTDFNRDTFQENSNKSISIGYGAGGGSVFMGTKSFLDFTPNYTGVTSTLSVPVPTGLELGGMASYSKSKLKEVLVKPK